ncbi:MAG: neutral/alkaline non-lysosomal ceramidase N-terminal domain-containing protein [Bacteroidota bacterium]
MKLLKGILKVFSGFLLIIIVFLAISIQPVQEQDFNDTDYFGKTTAAINTFQWNASNDTVTPLEVGWASGNIMPEGISPMAGYRYRGAFEEVHDSLYCRVFVLEKGEVKAALIELDLLIFPPSVTQKLKTKLASTHWKFEELYLSASHTHSGVGNWAAGLYGIFVSGGYDEGYVEKITNTILTALGKAYQEKQESHFGYKEIAVPEYVRNRLTDEGTVNDQLKLIKFVREDSSQAALVSYTAHPTTISSRYLAISNDYPYYLMREIIQHEPIDFCAFFAGAMGSHGPTGQKGKAGTWFQLPETIGKGLAKKVVVTWDSIQLAAPKTFAVGKIPLYFDDLHIRVSKELRTRNWLFEAVAGEQLMDISLLQIGNLTMLSTPFDFSGELALQLEEEMPLGRHLMINNFNGAYIGYITPDDYYHRIKRPETMEMNWLGPQNGSYVMEILSEILEKTSQGISQHP